jgi:hypothetical protein
VSEGKQFCENCGTAIGETTNFCPNCGAAQKPDPGLPTGPPPVPENGRMGREVEREPLMEVRSSSFGTGRPASLKIFEDGLELRYAHNPINIVEQNLGYEQIAQVLTRKGMFFSTLVIETRGGGSLSVSGLVHGAAKQAAALIASKLRY